MLLTRRMGQHFVPRISYGKTSTTAAVTGHGDKIFMCRALVTTLLHEVEIGGIVIHADTGTYTNKLHELETVSDAETMH